MIVIPDDVHVPIVPLMAFLKQHGFDLVIAGDVHIVITSQEAVTRQHLQARPVWCPAFMERVLKALALFRARRPWLHWYGVDHRDAYERLADDYVGVKYKPAMPAEVRDFIWQRFKRQD